MFVNDYRPTKRIGIEEMDGCLNLLGQRIEELDGNRSARTPYYKGASLALELLRLGKFEYPQDFMAVFDNKMDELLGDWS